MVRFVALQDTEQCLPEHIAAPHYDDFYTIQYSCYFPTFNKCMYELSTVNPLLGAY